MGAREPGRLENRALKRLAGVVPPKPSKPSGESENELRVSGRLDRDRPGRGLRRLGVIPLRTGCHGATQLNLAEADPRGRPILAKSDGIPERSLGPRETFRLVLLRQIASLPVGLERRGEGIRRTGRRRFGGSDEMRHETRHHSRDAIAVVDTIAPQTRPVGASQKVHLERRSAARPEDAPRELVVDRRACVFATVALGRPGREDDELRGIERAEPVERFLGKRLPQIVEALVAGLVSEGFHQERER